MKLWRKGLALAMCAGLMTAVFAGTAMAKEERTKISSIQLTVDSDIQTGDDTGDVSVTTEASNYRVTDVEIVNDEGEWTAGDKPKVEVTLEADSDYYFGSISSSKVKLRGDDAKYTGSRREDSSSTLIVKLTLDELEGSLDIDETYWDNDTTPIAQWSDTDGAKNYQVRLYRGSSSVGETVTTSNSYYNYASKITRTGEYYSKVRVVNNNNKKGEWYESDYLYVDDELLSRINSGAFNNVSNDNNGGNTTSVPGVTNAQWIKDNVGWWYRYADGSYPKDGWLQIGGIWYCFDSVGYMRTGWVQAGNQWYYCDTASGAMLTNTRTPDGFWVDGNGVWIP